MATVRVGPRHQVTIPKKAFLALKLDVGDLLEAQVEQGKLVYVPKRLVEKAPVPKLTLQEQKILARARKKIERIKKDLLHVRGLTLKEAQLAVKVGLIPKDQAYWWMEEWQKGEREAEADTRAGRVKAFDTVEDFIKNLRS